MQTMAVVNQKGGCGKTTTAVNLAVALAERGKSVVLIDLDPQAHATLALGCDPDGLHQTIGDALADPQGRLSDALVATSVEGLSLVPANILLASADLLLWRQPQREMLLAARLRDVRDGYDMCVMDCAPSFGMLTINAIVASTDVIVPVQTQYYSLEGLRRVLESIRTVQSQVCPHSAERQRILLTCVEERTLAGRQIQQQVRDSFRSRVFETVIHRDVRLSEAPSAGESALTYAPRCRGAREYRQLAAEVMGSSEVVQAGRNGGNRRGLQKDLSAFFRINAN